MNFYFLYFTLNFLQSIIRFYNRQNCEFLFFIFYIIFFTVICLLLPKGEESNSFIAKNSQISLHSFQRISKHEYNRIILFNLTIQSREIITRFQINCNSFESDHLAKQHEILRSERNVLPSAHRRSIPNRMGIFGLHLSRNKSYGVSSGHLKEKTIEIRNS